MENAPLPKRKYSRSPYSVAYTLSLPFGIELDVKASPNAWWMNRELMEKLIQAFKIDATIDEACAHAGISLRQYKYFTSLHQEFKEARRGLSLQPALQAKLTIMRALQAGNLKVSMWYLTKRFPEEFGPVSRRKKMQETPPDYTKGLTYNDLSEASKKVIEVYERDMARFYVGLPPIG